MNYCPERGNILEVRRIDDVERKAGAAPKCNFVDWDNPIPVVAALVQYQDKIVLARNSQWPDGMFSLITGYLERNETPKEAVVREVKEALGLDGRVQEFLGCYSLVEKNQIILAHWVMATGELKSGNEIAGGRFCLEQN